MSRPRTRPQNAEKHPGLPDLPGRQRRSRAQIAEDNRILQETRETQERVALEGLQRLAAMQAGMEEAEEQSLAKRPKGVKPHARPVKKRVAPVNVTDKGKSGQANDAELPKAGVIEGQGESGRDDDNAEGIKERTKTQKRGKASLKEAINDARGSLIERIRVNMESSQEPRADDRKGKLSPAMCVVFYTIMLMLTESTLFFLNLTSKSRTNPKISLGGRIKGWASSIPKRTAENSQGSNTSDFRSHTTASALSLAHGPPSSILSSAQATSVSGVSNKSCQEPKASLAPPVREAFVGTFSDDGLDDDSQERLDAIISKTKGKKSILKVRGGSTNK